MFYHRTGWSQNIANDFNIFQLSWLAFNLVSVHALPMWCSAWAPPLASSVMEPLWPGDEVPVTWWEWKNDKNGTTSWHRDILALNESVHKTRKCWHGVKPSKQRPGVRKMPKVEQSKIGLPELDLCFLYTSVSCLPNPENCKFWTILTCDVLGDTLEPAPLCADFWNFQCLTRSRRCCFGTPQHTKRQRMYNGTELTLSQAQDYQYFTFYFFYLFLFTANRME